MALVEEIRTDRQLTEVAKVSKNGGTDIALVMTDAEKKKAPCFAIRDGKTCTAGSSCPYSHDTKIIAEAKAKVKAKAKAKPKAQPAAAAPEKGKGKGKGKGKCKGKRICWHFNNAPAGCQKGSECTFLHESPAMAAKVEAPSAPAQPNAASTVSQPAGRAGAQ